MPTRPETTHAEPPQPQSPKRAAIDLGSNMIRCAIGRKARDGRLELLDRTVKVPRLADGLGATGRLGQAGLERAGIALQQVIAQAHAAGVASIGIAATGALRQAGNRAESLAYLESRAGLPIRIIDGESEATLALHGVRTHLAAGADLAVIDVGGSSTEFVVARGPHVDAQSLQVGVITLSEWVARAAGPSDEGDFVARLRASAREHVARAEVRQPVLDLPCFATGGAAVALAAFRRGASYVDFVPEADDALPRDELETIFAGFLAAPREQRAARLRISPEHVDLVPAGFALLTAVLDRFGVRRILPTMRGVAEGLLWDATRGDDV